jgi:chromosome segregation ATPase
LNFQNKTVSSPLLSRNASPARSPLRSMPELIKEMADLRAKASLAGEIGKALLETNQSLQGEKAALRQQAETAQRRLDATSRQVADLMHENEDARTRMTSLVAHCEQLEKSNAALGRALERPSAGQQQQQERRAASEQQVWRVTMHKLI